MNNLKIMKPKMSNDDDIKQLLLANKIETHFLDLRKIFLFGIINDEISSEIIKKLLYLESLDEKKDIELYVNSPGGIISSGLAIYDAIQMIRPDVKTICMGQAASMGAVLLAGGSKGKRYSWSHSRILIHQPLISGYMEGPASDIEIQAEEMLRMRQEINYILSQHTGQPIDKIKEDTDRDKYMSAKEAQAYGLIDKIIE